MRLAIYIIIVLVIICLLMWAFPVLVQTGWSIPLGMFMGLIAGWMAAIHDGY